MAEGADTLYNQVVRLIVDNISVEYSIPEEKVILQNAHNNGCMYVILNGLFDVQSLQFNRAARMKQAEGDAKAGRPPGVVRTLSCGNYYGEISPMFNCKRSATVMARNYGTYGELDKEAMRTVMAEYPRFMVFMWESIMSIYDDDLKIFLFENLCNIDYLKPIAAAHPAIITHLGFCMEAQFNEAGEHLFWENKSIGVDELIIIFDGVVELYSQMDSGTDFTIEHLSKGSILNAHSFVVLRSMPISARFAVNTTYYTLSAKKFGDIAADYEPLRKIYNDVYLNALAARERNANMLV